MRMIIGRGGLRLGDYIGASPTETPLHALCHRHEPSLVAWLTTSYARPAKLAVQNSSRARDFTVPFSKRADQPARFATPELLGKALLLCRLHRNPSARDHESIWYLTA